MSELTDRLEAIDAGFKSAASVTIQIRSPEHQAISQAAARIRVLEYLLDTARKGLAFYAPGPFWTEVLKDTKAAQDMGTHAEWVLRLTDENAA